MTTDGRDDGFVTKDSGRREEYPSGMRRDTQEGKPRYDLIDRAFLRRWANLMARGAEKYGEENWRLAETEEELRRFKASALRHMMQWLDELENPPRPEWVEDEDLDEGGYWYNPAEDHAAAVAFNVAAAEMVKGKLNQPKQIRLNQPEQIRLGVMEALKRAGYGFD